MPHGATCETRILRIFAGKKPNEKMRQYIKKSILLTLSILISIVANAYDFEVGGIYYNKDGNCAIVTSGDSKYSGDVSIPSTVNYGGMEYSVTSIDSYAFADCTGLTSVAIPKSVTKIGYGAFGGCSGLTSVHITDLAEWCKLSFGMDSNPLTYAHHLFLNGEEIKDLVVPSSVTCVGDSVFCNCTGIKTVTIPNTVTSIGRGTFSGCTSLSSINIPNSVTSIGESAFSDCTGLISVTIPNLVNSIEWGTFSHCHGLTSVAIPNSVSSIGGSAFSGCSSLTSVTIPNSVTTIGDWAFYGCSGLTSVTIGNSVTSIGNLAFANCRNLKSVISEIEVPFTIDSSVFFSDTENNGQLTVPKGKKSAYQSTDGWNEFSNIVESISSYTLTIQSSSGGYVSYNGANISATTKTFTIDEGTSVTFTITPNSGYKLSSLTVNGTNVTSSVSNNKYTISSISANTTVVVKFTEMSPAYSYSYLSYIGTNKTYYDSDAFEATGYEVYKTTWYETEFDLLHLVNMTRDDFEAIYEEEPVADGNDNYTQFIKKDGKWVECAEDETLGTLTIIPDLSGETQNKSNIWIYELTGDDIDALYAQWTPKTAEKTFEIERAYRYEPNTVGYSDIYVVFTTKVTFKPIPRFTLSLSTNTGGSLSYNGYSVTNTTNSFSVKEGSSATITITPNSGYRLSRLTVNGTNVTSSVSNNQYTISNITANTTVVATFEQIPATTYSLSIQSGAGGSVSYNGTTVTNTTRSFTVNEGTSATITITPNTGYILSRLTVNGTNVTSSVSNNQYTISNITANTTVVATFEQIPATTYSLSIQSGSGGSVSYNGMSITNTTKSFTVSEGSSVTLTITPNSGYKLSSLTVNGTNVTSSVSNNKYTISSFSANTTVVAKFTEMSSTYSYLSYIGTNKTYYDSDAFEATGYVVYEDSKIENDLYKLLNLTQEEFEAVYKDIPVISNGKYTQFIKKEGQWVVCAEDETLGILTLMPDLSGETQKMPTTWIYELTGDDIDALYAQWTPKTAEKTFEIERAYKYEPNTVGYSDIYVVFTTKVTFKPIPKFTLSLSTNTGGSLSYNGYSVTNTTNSFSVKEGSSVTITITPNTGYKLSSLTVNGTNVTSSVSNNKYTISSISANTTVVAKFTEITSDFIVGSISYVVASLDNNTIKVRSGSYIGHITIPSTVSYNGTTWNVTGIDNGAFKNCTGLISIVIPSTCSDIGTGIFEGCTGLAAVTWNPEIALTGKMFGEITNPNLLLYTSSKSYAPYGINNVVVNGEASEITLVDATSGNNFYCPQAFKAKSISYTHEYSMTTGRGNSQGWETIALPFDVTKITHITQIGLKPFGIWTQGSSERPFWLYRLTQSGWTAEKQIKANTPYIISMPNNTTYQAGYNVSGQVTYSAENATVAATSAVNISSNGSKQFVPNFTEQTSGGSIYAINANNALGSYAGSYTEGSVFTNSPARTVHPFEAYTKSTNNAKGIIPIFDTTPTGISILLGEECSNFRIYSLAGQLVRDCRNTTYEEAIRGLAAGVYLVNGKKLYVKP